MFERILQALSTIVFVVCLFYADPDLRRCLFLVGLISGWGILLYDLLLSVRASQLRSERVSAEALVEIIEMVRGKHGT